MAAARSRGVRLGRPVATIPAAAAARIAELRDQGMSLAAIAAHLNDKGVRTLSGRGRWAKSSVQYVLSRLDQPAGQQEAKVPR
jgi:O-acetylhomoserine/O-acetylserine sulfhydrylase-like pyridoxal-dependent enzyme